MNPVVLVAFGWLVPGGAYLLMRRYLQFAMFACAVSAAFALGLALHGGILWPEPGELTGLDGFTALAFQGAAAIKVLAGLPYLAARVLGLTGSLVDARMHEYGSTLLTMAGVANVLAISSALDLRKEARR